MRYRVRVRSEEIRFLTDDSNGHDDYDDEEFDILIYFNIIKINMFLEDNRRVSWSID